MKILFKYLKPYRWLVALTLTLAAINMGFSLFDPILFGKLVNLAGDSNHQYAATKHGFDWNHFFWAYGHIHRDGKNYLEIGVFYVLIFSMSVAMISRISKNFQDYFLNVIIQKFG